MIAAIVVDSLTTRRDLRITVVQKCARVTTNLRTARTPVRVAVGIIRGEEKTAAKVTIATERHVQHRNSTASRV